MKLFFTTIAFLAMSSLSFAQSSTPACSYTVTRTPVGAMEVYKNGSLQRQVGVPTGEVGNYTAVNAPGTFRPVITPLAWSDGDKMSVVFTRAVPLSFTSNGQTVSYWGYTLWREDWNCTGQFPLLLQVGGLALASGTPTDIPVCELSGRALNIPVPVGTVNQVLSGVPFISSVFQVTAPTPVPCPSALTNVATTQGLVCYSGVWAAYDHDVQ